MNSQTSFPRQMLSFSAKNEKWAKSVVDWAENKTYFNDANVSSTVHEMRINYDLLNGKIHMEDLRDMIDPFDLNASFVPEKIRHFPIMNSKLNVLIGEESRRSFDFSVAITNPESINNAAETKRQAVVEALQSLMQEGISDENEFNEKAEKLDDWFKFSYRDMREVMANELVKSLNQQYDVPTLFNIGFKDVMAVGGEIYQWVIEGGEPVPYRLDPMSVRVFRSGYSNRIEDADAVIIEEYWSPGRIYDAFYDVLTDKDRKYIEEISTKAWGGFTDAAGYRDERKAFIDRHMISDEVPPWSSEYWEGDKGLFRNQGTSLLPYDGDGNIRVIRVYWKSKRKIKRIKSYDEQTGEEVFDLYPENIHADKNLGEEEKTLWINEAWEGTKIGEEVYVNMQPCPVQYGTASNPSRCHFGIVGSYYNLNGDRPYPLVSIMKNYNYEYDVLHHELLCLIEKNMGKVIPFDLAKKPADWPVEKIIHFAKTNGLLIQNSFNEGQYGAATGKLAGGMNNNTTAWDADLLSSANEYIQLMEYIKEEMGDVVGINRQREGQVYNRETVGGIERANLQSSHITEWLFVIHENVKKRFWEVGLETAKIAYKGNKKTFENKLSDGSRIVIELDGDEFSEADYGIVVDNTEWNEKFKAQLDSLAQAAVQNHMMNISTIAKLYGTMSMSEKQRIIENAEKKMEEQEQQAQQAQQQAQQQAIEAQQQSEQLKYQTQDNINQRDNDTRLLVAQINGQSRIQAELAYADAVGNSKEDDTETMSAEARSKLDEQIREYDIAMNFEREKFRTNTRVKEKDLSLKEKSINNPSKRSK